MGLFLSNIHSDIFYSLQQRQDNDDVRLKWLNKRNAWVRATSLVEVDGDKNLRLNWILYGGTSSKGKLPSGYKELYDTNNRPFPGITSFSISNKGSMGSTREAQISFTCWTIDQLNIMEKLYMSLGMSILIEWGWNYTVDGDAVISDLHLKEPISDYCMTKEIEKLIIKYKGHYDGMQGVVTNFNWSLNNNGGFDCSITVTSVGALFLDMNIHSQSKKLYKYNVANEKVLVENIKGTIKSIIDNINDSDNYVLYIDNKAVGFRIDVEASGKDSNFSEYDKRNDRQYYITWEFFEKGILNNNLTIEMEQKMNCLTDKNSYINNIQNTLPIFDSSDTKLSYTGFDFSADPFVCILPYSEIKLRDIVIFWGVKQTIPTEFRQNLVNKEYFYLKDLLINLRLIVDALDNTDKLTDFMKYILNAINEVNANSWDLSLFVDELEPHRIRVVDYRVKDEEIEKITPFVFKVYNIKSIVKSVNLTTEVSEDLKAMIMYGANRDNVENLSNGQTWQYFFFGSKLRNLAVGKVKPKPSTKKIDESKTIKVDKNNWSKEDYESHLEKAFKKVYDSWAGRTEENVSNLKDIMLKCKNDNFGVLPSKEDKTSSNLQYLPLRLSLTIDGLSGLKYGNLISIDYLPDRYLNSIVFQITNINHTINGSLWETSIETIMRVNLKELEFLETQQTITYNTSNKLNGKMSSGNNYYGNYSIAKIDNNNEKSDNDMNINKKEILWIIDMGHGINPNPYYKRYPPDGQNDGSGVPQLLEYKFNRDVGNKLLLLLKKNGKNAISIINSDIDMPINKRVKLVNTIVKNNLDKLVILISIHGNKENINSGIGTAGGVMTIISSKSFMRRGRLYTKDDKIYNLSKYFASIFYKYLNDMWIKTVQNKQVYKDFRIAERGDLGLLNFSNCPAIILENGFYSNPIDRKFMLSEEGQLIIAKTIYKAINEIEQQYIYSQIS